MPNIEPRVWHATPAQKLANIQRRIEVIQLPHRWGTDGRNGWVLGGLLCTADGSFPGAPGVPPVRLEGLRRHAQKFGDWTREGRFDVDVIHQCLHCCTQCGTGQRFSISPPFTSDKELAGILVHLPQEVDHEDGSNPVLEEPLVAVTPIACGGTNRQT